MAAMTLDIGDAGAIEDFARRAIAEHPDLNVLINNAGIMRFESLDRRNDLTDAEATITTNLLGPIRLTNVLIDHLSARTDAAIVHVTSGLAFVPLLTTPTHNATTAEIHSSTVPMRPPLKGNIRTEKSREG